MKKLLSIGIIGILISLFFVSCEKDNETDEKIEETPKELIILDNATSSNFFSDLSNPTGLEIDSDGYLYVAEYGANQISKIEIESQTKTIIADIDDGILKPVGVTIYNNYLYCTNNGGKVFRINLSNYDVQAISDLSNKKLGDIEVFNESEIYVSEFDMNSSHDNGGGDYVYKINAQTGNIDFSFQGLGLGVYGLKYFDNKMLVAHLSDCSLMEIDLNNNTINNLETQIVAQLGDIIIAPNNMIISTEIIIGENDLGNEIVFIDMTTKEVVSYHLTEDCKPFGVVIKDSNLFVSEFKTGKIIKITGIIFNTLDI